MELEHDLQRIAEELRFAAERLDQFVPVDDDAVARHRLQIVRDHLHIASRIAARLTHEAARAALGNEAA